MSSGEGKKKKKKVAELGSKCLQKPDSIPETSRTPAALILTAPTHQRVFPSAAPSPRTHCPALSSLSSQLPWHLLGEHCHLRQGPSLTSCHSSCSVPSQHAWQSYVYTDLVFSGQGYKSILIWAFLLFFWTKLHVCTALPSPLPACVSHWNGCSLKAMVRPTGPPLGAQRLSGCLIHSRCSVSMCWRIIIIVLNYIKK